MAVDESVDLISAHSQFNGFRADVGDVVGFHGGAAAALLAQISSDALTGFEGQVA